MKLFIKGISIHPDAGALSGVLLLKFMGLWGKAKSSVRLVNMDSLCCSLPHMAKS